MCLFWKQVSTAETKIIEGLKTIIFLSTRSLTEVKNYKMAGKRSATSELNHDNWDEDVEPEDAGKFSQADENILKGRIVFISLWLL